MLKKPDFLETNQPKSKIFIKDVTLLRKPDLPHNDIAIPNIFDSLDLTTTEDDIFDDFLGPDEAGSIFGEDDFDFDESANLNNVESLPTPDPVPEVEIVTPAPELIAADPQTGKIFVRRNLCDEGVTTEVVEDATDNNEVPTSKIYVRSHESLTSQLLTTELEQQPSEATTPDCIIVSSEIISEAPPSKIFIRNIETLTNPQQESATDQFYPVEAPTDDSFINLPSNYPMYVHNFDNLVTDTRPSQASTPNETMPPQPRCKISIKNMNTLIEPILMQPPLNASSMIFGQAQNLVIHMRPQQTDESLLSYRDTSMTPDTLPGSSNVSVCGGNDDVIILDDSEVYPAFDISEIQANNDPTAHISDEIFNGESSEIECTTTVINPQSIEAPERNETPSEKSVLQKLELTIESSQQQEEGKEGEEQPMVRIPIDFTEPEKEPERKKVKIVKIIRIKRKRESSGTIQNSDLTANVPLSNIQVVFKCSFKDCSQHFTSEQLLKYHRKCHGPDGLIVCPECSSDEFKNFTTLRTHLWRLHKVDIDLFACELCNFKTPILSRLKNFHEKIHSDERNFKCSFQDCQQSFKNSQQLKNHFEVHKRSQAKAIADTKADEKKFKCEECDYSTNDHNAFRRHKSQHSNHHQYKCPTCDYTSIQSSTYRKHLERQHPDLAESLLFKCTMCKFTTISKGKFDGHIFKHDEIRIKSGKKSGHKIKVKSNFSSWWRIYCRIKTTICDN